MLMNKTKQLKNKNILITRAKKQSEKFIYQLEELGANVFCFPVIEIVSIQNEELNNCINNINLYDWVIFTSTNSVEIFFDEYKKYKDISELKAKIAVVGPKVAKEIEGYNLKVDLIPEKYNAESLAELFKDLEIENKNILIPGSKISRDTLKVKLEELNAKVNFLSVYDTVRPHFNSSEKLKLDKELKIIDYITFMSPSAVKNFFQLLSENDLQIYNNNRFVCIGDLTATEIRKYLSDKNFIIADNHTSEGMIESIIFDIKK